MEFAASMRGMSFRQKPRAGQESVFAALATHPQKLNVKLPTGYGKTYTCCGVYSILKDRGRVNRLLILFPTDSQLEQFVKDGPSDLRKVSVEGPAQIVDIRYHGDASRKLHRMNKAQVFVTTIQSLIQPRVGTIVDDLLSTSLWMICVDEYHHYGLEKSWGQTVLGLPRQYLLAMSATPSRPKDDSAFGTPDVSVSYQAAYEEGAVKKLVGHAYHYGMDLETPNGVRHLTTQELIAEVGDSTPDKIEKFCIQRHMRWLPTFVQPLVSIPIERMISQRIGTGHSALQVLVSAVCVSHARVVCEQIQIEYPMLRVDWVGTGENGREADQNRAVLERFCPPKDINGDRAQPTIDVLVHVGMAGEGLDSIQVSEVVLLTNASVCNRINQTIGRAARKNGDIIGHINFDASTDYAAYTGSAIMRAVDELPAQHDPDGADQEEDDDLGLGKPLPDEPIFLIQSVELEGVDSGDEGVQRMAQVASELAPNRINLDALMADLKHPDWDLIKTLYRKKLEGEAADHNEKARTAKYQDDVTAAAGKVAGLFIKLLQRRGLLFSKDWPGSFRRQINRQKKIWVGELNADNRDAEKARQHYLWVKQLERETLASEQVPHWLAF
jgi:superfamily II DNA or RNA helicase